MNTQPTWSGTQALNVIDGLAACIRSNMVRDYFDDEDKASLKVLLDKAKVGHALAIESAYSKTV